MLPQKCCRHTVAREDKARDTVSDAGDDAELQHDLYEESDPDKGFGGNGCDAISLTCLTAPEKLNSLSVAENGMKSITRKHLMQNVTTIPMLIVRILGIVARRNCQQYRTTMDRMRCRPHEPRDRSS